MTPTTLMLTTLAAGPTAVVQFDRVDLISEDPGTFVNYELAGAPTYPTKAAIRFVTQIKPVVAIPRVPGLTVGVSLSSQSVVYERPFLVEGLHWTAGVQTALLMPRGALGGVAYRTGRWRFGVSASAISGSTWARPSYGQWTVLPTVGVGVGRKPQVEFPDGP